MHEDDTIPVEADDFVSPAELRGLLMSAMRAHSQLSDLNFTPGRMPQIEVHGELREVALGHWNQRLQPFDTEVLAEAIIGEDPRLKEALETSGATDCALELANGTRFRINIFRARDEISIAMRILPSEVPSLERLGLPKILEEVPRLKSGLVLVSGATGSGKSTTLAAIVNRINQQRRVHIVTLEDPIEFVHTHQLGTVNQREKGRDFFDYASGLRSSLRQGPRVILVGELRDRETLEIALKAAETGHLVLSSLHTVRPGDAIRRVVGMFEVAERELIRGRISQVLRFIVGQRLLPTLNNQRVAAVEVLGNNLRVRHLIENGESPDNSFSMVINDNRPRGWQSFDHHIVEHLKSGLISEEVARSYCTDRSAIGREIDRWKHGRGESTSELGDLELENENL